MKRYDILREFPHQIETERLKIRLPLPGDGLELYEATKESLQRLKPWLSWTADLELTPEQSEASVRHNRARFLERKQLQFLLFLKGTERLVGVSGLFDPDWAVPKFEIGFWVRSGYEGQGYITEAVAAIGDFAFNKLGAKRVEMRCDPLNKKSIAIARRLGYEHEATLRHYKRHHESGELRDVMIFAKVAGQ